ncbi:hypothetical protein D9O29_24185, partial [Pantoea vagans]
IKVEPVSVPEQVVDVKSETEETDVPLPDKAKEVQKPDVATPEATTPETTPEISTDPKPEVQTHAEVKEVEQVKPDE